MSAGRPDPDRGDGHRRGLLVDFGGVLTTNVFESFRAFCEAEGLEPDAVKSLFRERGEGLALLRQLEKGELEVDEFSERFAPLLGVREVDGLVDRLFAGVIPDEPMIEAVRSAHRKGVPTGLISNSWGGTTYDTSLIEELFDGVVISGEVGLHK
ncbi:MAG: HAD family phosphatase, partial [Actinobacteria bacterium]